MFSTSQIQQHGESVSLKICMINDVYELDYLPHYCTARREEESKMLASTGAPANKTIGCLPGDFLAPSFLASIDKGQGMVDSLNQCQMDFVCIGNHESDMDFRQFNLRIKESKFQWINSNMPGLPLDQDVPHPLPEFVIIEISSADGTHKRRVALLGLCCEDRSVLKPGAFGGCAIEPVNSTARRLYEQLMARTGDEKVHAVIPMTHQLMFLDRELAQANPGVFPLILG